MLTGEAISGELVAEGFDETYATVVEAEVTVVQYLHIKHIAEYTSKDKKNTLIGNNPGELVSHDPRFWDGGLC